ncbi:MAG: glucosidase [Parachlamydia sp.]|nr:glucosidase [Parachlamydia sp.]
MPTISVENPERQRLEAHHAVKANWKHWGPYLSDRAWGTVREDYSADGDAWRYFPHEHARSRVYRWNEDGIAGISDRNQYLCFALGLWNGRDPILKERFFGLAGHEGNHGEDVKDYYFYLDNTPTHTYMKMLYKYPQGEFPYEKLREENGKRGYGEPEYELLDTGIFDQEEYFDFFVEYAKASENDLLIEISVYNRSKRASPCTLLPTLWFRNTWSWGYPYGPMGDVPSKPQLRQIAPNCIEAQHPTLGLYYLYAETEQFLFTENETNFEHLYGTPNGTPYVKDAFHRYVIQKEAGAVNPAGIGTKAAALATHLIPPGEKVTMRLRLKSEKDQRPFEGFEEVLRERKREADLFYEALAKPGISDDERLVMRQAFAGLLWSKQLYYYDVEHWLKGDPRWPPPSDRRPDIRNGGWEHLVNFDIISMPDKWEYPWYASWDLSFHCISVVQIDPDFAKRQLTLMTREWYMHPNGQLPAYEWNFQDVNPPVHAWAALKVYEIDAKITGKRDRDFLKGIFHKLLLNFTWWVNRKDLEGNNVFQGGFLGLDNISIFDRSKPLPTGGQIAQSDGTAWMAFYCVMMMKIALELAQDDPVYQDSATKFFEHFQRIAGAMSSCSKKGCGLWNEEDQFFYDVLLLPNGRNVPLKVRSLVGLLPLFAMETLEPQVFEKAPVFERRLEWFMNRHPVAMHNMACVYTPGMKKRRQMGIVIAERLEGILKYLLDEKEFLSDFGIRSLSKYHQEHPYRFDVEGASYEIHYQPAESESGLFGGNSNWRGPVWFPINLLIIESLKRFHAYYGDDLKVDFPTGSGVKMNLQQIADELSQRLIRIFLRNPKGKRPVFGNLEKFQNDPHWRDNLLFYEYFHGETGAGLGASHQTGWTAVVTNLILQS